MKTIKHNYSGKSILELKREYGTGSSGFLNQHWYDSEEFAFEHPPKGVYELDLSNDFNNLNYEEQINKIKKGWIVTHPAIVAEAILELYQKTGKRLVEIYWLRTSSIDFMGGIVSVGHFDSDGLDVRGLGDFRDAYFGVASAKKLK